MHENRRTRLLLAILLLAALALITVSYQGNGAGAGAGGGIFGPAEHLAGDITGPIEGFFHAATHDDASEIASLQAQNDQLRAQLAHQQVSQADAAQLQKLLQLAGRGGYRVVAASVVAAGGEYSDTVTVDAGTKDGIAPSETVLNGDGLVGVVTSAGPTTSTVQLLTDASVTVGIRLAGSNTIGEVTGAGTSMATRALLQLRLFSATAPLKKGDAVVTFGSMGGRPYVPGVPVGTVTQVTSSPGSLTQTALVTPFADLTSVGVVGIVIAPPRTNPRDSVLPPTPPPPRPAAKPKPGTRATPAPQGTP